MLKESHKQVPSRRIKLTACDIKAFVIEKQTSGLSANTVRIILSYLSAILNEAVDDELLQGNPAARVRKVIAKDHKEEINPLTAGELDHLLNTVQQHFPKHYTLFLLLARTGMRIGEALALRWADIDFKGRFIEVKRSVVRGRISTPKSGKSRRVDMSPQLADTLKIHLTESKKRGLVLGIGEPELIFMNRKGGLIDVNNWRRRVFNKALTKAEVRTIRIHDLRHTYTTLRLRAGHNIVDVSKQLGHHSVKLTLDVYGHWVPGQNKSQVDALDSLHLSAPYPHSEADCKEKRTRESV
jgi:integrase